MIWISTNHVATATITALTENPNYLFDDAFKDTRLSRYGRTLDDASQTIVFDLGATAKDVYYVIIDAHNFTSGATIKIQANATNAWTAPTVDQTLTWATDRIVYKFSAKQTYRYWRLSVNDASNTDTYLQIGKVWLSDYLQLPGMAKNQKIPLVSTASVQESDSGQSYGGKKIQYKQGNISFPYVTDAQKAQIDAVFATIDKTDPLWIIVWEDDITTHPAIYSRLTTDLEWQRVEGVAGRWWSLQFGFKQIF